MSNILVLMKICYFVVKFCKQNTNCTILWDHRLKFALEEVQSALFFVNEGGCSGSSADNLLHC